MHHFEEAVEMFNTADEIKVFGHKPERRYFKSRIFIRLYPNEKAIFSPQYKIYRRMILDIQEICDKYDLNLEEVLKWKIYYLPMHI